MTDKSPLISVIVPIYKVEPYLEKCVQSIQNQTYKNLEIILVDDGSPDACGDMCDKFAQEDSRIIVVHRENGGLSAARNSGLDVAHGEYVGFVDSDDYIDGDMLECLYRELVAHKSELAVCRARILSEHDGQPFDTAASYSVTEYRGDEAHRYILQNLDNSVWNKLFFREAIGALRFPHGKIHGEDFIFVLQYLRRITQIVVLNCEKYNYIKHKNSITQSSFSKSSLDEIYVKDYIQDYISQYYPNYLYLANKWCVKARINIVRQIMLSEHKNTWHDELRSCREYIKRNYRSVRRDLSKKERMEYFLQRYFRPVYPFIMRQVLKLK